VSCLKVISRLLASVVLVTANRLCIKISQSLGNHIRKTCLSMLLYLRPPSSICLIPNFINMHMAIVKLSKIINILTVIKFLIGINVKLSRNKSRRFGG